MTWGRRQRALLEMRIFEGKEVPHVIGYEGVRECGCAWIEGMRMDDRERTFGCFPCERHGAQMNRAFETFRLMPPQEVTAYKLFEQLVEDEIRAAPA